MVGRPTVRSPTAQHQNNARRLVKAAATALPDAAEVVAQRVAPVSRSVNRGNPCARARLQGGRLKGGGWGNGRAEKVMG